MQKNIFQIDNLFYSVNYVPIMRYLITGGEGFIGRYLKEELERGGNEVFSLDIEGRPDFKISILDYPDLLDAMKGIDGVFHLAAVTAPPQFEVDPNAGFRTNVIGTLNVLQSSASNGVKKAVLASSSSIYGNTLNPGSEDMQIYGHENLYATTKLFDEYIGRYFTLRKELEVVSLRFFNTYGIGENSKGAYSSVISKFLDSILKDEKPVIFGNGNQSRDFIYIKDLVEGAEKAMSYGIPGEIYNMGTGISYSFNRILEIISLLLKREVLAEYIENPLKNYQTFTQANMERTSSILKWKPRFSLLEGITEICKNLGML